jgi:hypothetical protein
MTQIGLEVWVAFVVLIVGLLVRARRTPESHAVAIPAR